MSSETGGTLYGIYRKRIGRPTTHDEVRGYWVFLVGLLLGTLGLVLFLPSESAVGADGLTLREASIAMAAVGLAMLVAGPIIRLPLQSWANYAAYAGQAVCLAAVAWFVVVFPADWSVQTGSQPVVVLYALGLAITTIGGVVVPMIATVDPEEHEASQRRGQASEQRVTEQQARIEELEEKLAQADEKTAAGAAAQTEVEELQSQLASLRASQAQYELYEDAGGKFRWRLRHRNGNVVATSGQGYTRKHNAKKGLASVRRNSLGASMLEITPEPDETPEEALEEAPIIPDVAADSDAEFELYEDEGGQYRWRLVHDNGNVIADGGEGYSSKQNARKGIESVKRNADPASYLQFDPTSFEIYRDAAGEWRFRLVHKNGNILAAASEGYTRRRDAKRAVETVRDTLDDDRFEVYEDNRGEYRWRLTAANNEVIATSGEGYTDRGAAEEAVERIQEYAPDADALDVGFAAFEVYEDAAEQWRWRLRHRNGNLIADGGEGYSERTAAQDGIESVKRNAPGADVVEN